MAATVKPIEAKSVHQIQSGQVIVDLCSVVKELVENSLDAGANAVEVRFKNNGLDEIEVQDNGSGIAAVNYETVALKHYTSKLFTYDDLTNLQTFGFRGEALSSLCALSTFTITTAQANEAPKGHRLEFEISGKLKNTTIVACQKGTVATVQNLFEKLPVRRKELAKNVKREYGKVLGLLHAYACISTNVKFSVKNALPKGKSMTVFSTKSNATTRENIANVYGAKTLTALIALDLAFNFPQASLQATNEDSHLIKVVVKGHISKPIFGEGRQTPDRQMFFVNGRPCGLPQIAKAINEVYKSFNVSQSPFIFADLQMDTNAYDVNVSPDKRTIFLHNAVALTEKLKTALADLFDRQNQTVPQSHLQSSKLPAFKHLNVQRQSSADSLETDTSNGDDEVCKDNAVQAQETNTNRVLHDHFRNLASTREAAKEQSSERDHEKLTKYRERRASKIAGYMSRQREDEQNDSGNLDEIQDRNNESDSVTTPDAVLKNVNLQIRDFNARMSEQQTRKRPHDDDTADDKQELPEQSVTPLSLEKPLEHSGIVQKAFDRMRPKRLQPEVATITIGDKSVTRIVRPQSISAQERANSDEKSRQDLGSRPPSNTGFAKGLQRFSASGVQTFDPVALERIEYDDSGQSLSRFVQRKRPLVSAFDADEQDLESSEDEIEPETFTPTGKAFVPAEEDLDYMVEDSERAVEEKRVAELIRKAEDIAQRNMKTERRTTQALKGAKVRDSIVSLAVEIDLDIEELESLAQKHRAFIAKTRNVNKVDQVNDDMATKTVEERLSLTVSKADFPDMHIVGQFNLGFILAVRQKHQLFAQNGRYDNDELFIIDQHASDEKYNFERLQAETAVGNQRMVRPVVLDLTAVEEEIVLDSAIALEKNGFIVDVDTTGEQEVGKRCRLVSLPLSKEVVFDTTDLDELIHLLAESPMLNESSPVPRPSKVRKMFAMRACRSSIMIGKTLSRKQMSTILQHMGSIDKPWNCPHGRPTMRHLASLDVLDEGLWKEGDGVYPGVDSTTPGLKSASQVWKEYTQ